MDTFEDVKRRTLRYWYVDGLTEIAVGAVFLLLALLFCVIALISPSPAVEWLLGLGQPALILLGWWAGGRAVRHFKERITYPRTGYVEYKRQRARRRWVNIVLILLISAAVAALMASFLQAIPELWFPVISAASIAFFVVYMALQFGLMRFYPVAGAILLSGFLPVLLGLRNSPANALLMGAVAVIWIISGALALRSYLNHTQPAGEQQP